MMDPQPVSGEEAALIFKASRGDDAAWERLVRAHQEVVFRFAYLSLGDPDDAEDVAQETFIRAHRALSRFDLERPLRPWLLRIASNQASNRMRAAGRYWGALRRFARMESKPKPDEYRHGSLDDDRKILWSAIQELNQEDRRLIYLRYFMQFSIKETAQALDIPQGTVKSRSHRALGRLKILIENHYPDLLPGGFV